MQEFPRIDKETFDAMDEEFQKSLDATREEILKKVRAEYNNRHPNREENQNTARGLTANSTEARQITEEAIARNNEAIEKEIQNEVDTRLQSASQEFEEKIFEEFDGSRENAIAVMERKEAESNKIQENFEKSSSGQDNPIQENVYTIDDQEVRIQKKEDLMMDFKEASNSGPEL